jgi:hypothetical protein
MIRIICCTYVLTSDCRGGGEASVGRRQQAHPASMPHQTLVQQKIPSKLEVYVI